MKKRKSTKRERQLKGLGVDLKQAERRQKSISMLMKRKSRIKTQKAQDIATGIIHKYSANGGRLSGAQWQLVENLCKQ